MFQQPRNAYHSLRLYNVWSISTHGILLEKVNLDTSQGPAESESAFSQDPQAIHLIYTLQI